jgi:DUF971 family protein
MYAALIFVIAFLGDGGNASNGGLLAFEEAGKWGFKNAVGKAIVEPKYDEAREFAEGMAAVNMGAQVDRKALIQRKEGGKWGYIDARGNVVVPIAFDDAHDFSDGLAQVRDDRGLRYLDSRGVVVIELGRDYRAGDFREGLAPVYEDRSLQGKDWRTRFIDKKGSTGFTVDGYAEEFHEGLAVLGVEKRPGHSGDSIEPYRYGYVDRAGQVVISPRFAEAHEFSEGLAAARTKKTTVWRMGDTWGYIRKSGEYAIEPRFNEAHSFRGNVARVHVGGTLHVVHDGGEWLLIDKTGKVLKRSDKWLEYPNADRR